MGGSRRRKTRGLMDVLDPQPSSPPVLMFFIFFIFYFHLYLHFPQVLFFTRAWHVSFSVAVASAVLTRQHNVTYRAHSLSISLLIAKIFIVNTCELFSGRGTRRAF